MRGGSWKRTSRLNGSDAGRLAIKVFICEGCGLWHEGAKPKQCMACGRMDFARYDSKGEAKRWALLALLERQGLISELRRQVPFPLYTIGREGLPVEFATFVADYVYIENGIKVVEDWKPVAGMSPESALKIRCLEAAGTKVKIVNAKGTV